MYVCILYNQNFTITQTNKQKKSLNNLGINHINMQCIKLYKLNLYFWTKYENFVNVTILHTLSSNVSDINILNIDVKRFWGS